MSNSKRWLKEHFDDEYVKRAQKEGYPSRAAYKLLEIQQKDQIFKPGMTVVDLGAAPGGWSVVAQRLIGHKGHIIAIDILPMTHITGVDIIQGDFNDEAVYAKLQAKVAEYVENNQVDLVISDMAPNISGQWNVDQPRSLHLVELAWQCAQEMLKPDGVFLAKVFQGSGVDRFIATVRKHCKVVKIRKPKASRPRSREIYILGKGFLRYNDDSTDI